MPYSHSAHPRAAAPPPRLSPPHALPEGERGFLGALMNALTSCDSDAWCDDDAHAAEPEPPPALSGLKLARAACAAARRGVRGVRGKSSSMPDAYTS